LKAVIICKSIHKGNTRKIAEAVAEVLECEIKDPNEIPSQKISEYDLIGFASGIYIRNFHKSIRKMIEGSDGKGTHSFLLSTSGFPPVPLLHNYEKRMKKRLERNGFEVLGSFTCRGHDEYGPFKLIGGIHKKRPNEKDLERAKEFAEKIKDRFSSEEHLDYDIQPLEDRFISQVMEIAGDQLGKDYVDQEELERALDDESDLYSFIAVKGGEVIGYLNFEIQERVKIDEYLNIPRKDYPPRLKDAEKAGAIKAGSVKKKYQHRGVGTELNRKVLDKLEKEKINLAYTLGWIKEGEAAISGIMEKFGFEKIKELEEYWKEDSLDKGYSCSLCGEPPCTCSADIFVKEI